MQRSRMRLTVKILVLFMVVLVGSLLYSTAEAQEKKYTLTMATMYSPTSEMAKRNILPVIAEVKKRSQGRLEIKPYYAESLFKAKEEFDAIATGKVDMLGLINTVFATGIIPDWLSPFTPFLFDSYAHFDRAWNAGISDIWAAGGAKHNIVLLGNAPALAGLNYMYFSKKMPLLPDDMKGLKIRSFNVLLDTLIQDVGAAPVSMTVPDVYLAMQRGTADGFSSAILGGVEPFKLYEVSKFLNKVPIALGCPHFNAINKGSFDRLPKDLQVILTEVNSERLWTFSRKELPSLEEEYLKKWQQGGLKVHDPTSTELKAWRDKSKRGWSKFAELAGETGRKQIDIANKTR